MLVILQENVKTKHPQLLYESKLYRILQGGSNSRFCLLFPFDYVFMSNGTNYDTCFSWNTKCEVVRC